jgi:hypothetical protein
MTQLPELPQLAPGYFAGKHYDSLAELAADFPGHDVKVNGRAFTGWLRAAGGGHIGHLRCNVLLDELAADLAAHHAAVIARAEELARDQ